MSLYKSFLEENTNSLIIEIENKGFIEYIKYNDGSIYVCNLFVDEGHRKQGIAQLLEDSLIEKENPTQIVCNVQLEWKYPERSLIVFLTHGYKLLSATEKDITLIKTLEQSNG